MGDELLVSTVTYHAGPDVSLRSTHNYIVDDQGEPVVEATTGSQVRIILLPFCMTSVYMRKAVAGADTSAKNRRYR